MERSEPSKKTSEPALVPEWLKGSSSGGSFLHHFASSSQSDDHADGLPTKIKLSVSCSDYDSPRSSAFGDRNSSSYFQRSSSTNGSMKHEKEASAYSRNYSSFTRSNRDKDWDKDLDLRLRDHRDREYYDSLTSANILANRVDKDTLRRSKSMISGKRGELWTGRVGTVTNNGIHTGLNIVGNKHRTSFDRDFPTLGAEDKQGLPDVGRVSSPGLSSLSQSLPMGTLSVIGGDGWTSALAELPATVGSSSMILSSVQQTAPANSSTVLPSSSTGLNMAETVAQAPARARTSPQVSVETQRLEELAIKQCRQLIPMTPMPKTLTLNSSEKAKTKVARSAELSTSKVGQQPPLSPVASNIRVSARSDSSKTSQVGKLQPLKGPRDNGISYASKEGSSLTSASKSPHGALRSPSNPKLAPDLKLTSSAVAQSTSMERKLLPQTQNRIDFFNSLRKKTSGNHSAATPDSTPSMSSVNEKSDEQIVSVAVSMTKGNDTPASESGLGSSEWSMENGSDVVGNGDACEESQLLFVDDGEKMSSLDMVVIPDEEEVAFLRRLGWEEDAKYEALTEEEISAFYNEHKEKRPSSKLCERIQQSKIIPLGLHMGSTGGSSSGLSSSNFESKA